MATRYWWSKISDHVLHNSIACRPRPAVNFSNELNKEIALNGKKTPPRIRINRVLEIHIYRKKGSFYIPNPCKVLHTILSLAFTSTKWKPIQLSYCHVERNLANFVILTKFTYDFFIMHIFVAYNGEMVKYWNVKWWNGRFIQLIVLPLWAWHKNIHSYLFCRNGLIPKSGFWRIQDQSDFRIIIPNGITNNNSRTR